MKQLDSALKREIATRQAVETRFANWDNKLRKELVARHEAVEIVEMLTTLRQREKVKIATANVKYIFRPAFSVSLMNELSRSFPISSHFNNPILTDE